MVLLVFLAERAASEMTGRLMTFMVRVATRLGYDVCRFCVLNRIDCKVRWQHLTA